MRPARALVGPAGGVASPCWPLIARLARARGTALRAAVVWGMVSRSASGTFAEWLAIDRAARDRAAVRGAPHVPLHALATLAALDLGPERADARRRGLGDPDGAAGPGLPDPLARGRGPAAAGRAGSGDCGSTPPGRSSTGLLVVAGVTNYLPTRYGPAAAWLGLGFVLEYLGLTRTELAASRRGRRSGRPSPGPWPRRLATAELRAGDAPTRLEPAGGGLALVPRPLGRRLGAAGPGAVQPRGRDPGLAGPAGLVWASMLTAAPSAAVPAGGRGDLEGPAPPVRHARADRRRRSAPRTCPLAIRPDAASMMHGGRRSSAGRRSGVRRGGRGGAEPEVRHTSLVVLAVLGVIAALYLLKAILVPIALALVLACLLSPLTTPAPAGPARRPDGRGGRPVPADGAARALRRQPDGREPGAGAEHACRPTSSGWPARLSGRITDADPRPALPPRRSSPSRGRSTCSATPTATS